SPDPGEVRAELPISRMLYTVPYAGYLLAFATSPFGKALLVGMPAVVLAVLAFWRPGAHAGPSLSAIGRGVVDPAEPLGAADQIPDLLARAREGGYRVPPPPPPAAPPTRLPPRPEASPPAPAA